MISSELIAALHKLDRADKYRVVRLLVDELAVEENSRLTAVEPAPSFARLGDAIAAQALLDALREAEAAAQAATQRG